MSADIRSIVDSFILPGYLRSIAPYSAGHIAQKFFVYTGGRTCLLRRLRGVSASRATFVSLSQEHLAECAYAATLIKTKAGGFVTRRGRDSYLLSHFLVGAAYTEADALRVTDEMLGSFLGQLHTLYRTFDQPERGDCYLVFDHNPLVQLEELSSFHQSGDGDRLCLTMITDKQALLKRIRPEKLSSVDSLPKQTIHGDFYGDNIIIGRDGSIVGAIDFDQSCVFYRSYEVLRSAMLLLTATELNIERFLGRLRAFLTGYMKTATLSAKEASMMLLLYHWILLGDTFGLRPSRYRETDFRNLRSFALRRWGLAMWIYRNFDSIQNALETSCRRVDV